MCVMWAAMDFNMPTLALHMQRLEAPPVLVGAMFLIMAAAYTLSAPVVGLIAKTKVSYGLLYASSLLILLLKCCEYI